MKAIFIYMAMMLTLVGCGTQSSVDKSFPRSWIRLDSTAQDYRIEYLEEDLPREYIELEESDGKLILHQNHGTDYMDFEVAEIRQTSAGYILATTDSDGNQMLISVTFLDRSKGIAIWEYPESPYGEKMPYVIDSAKYVVNLPRIISSDNSEDE